MEQKTLSAEPRRSFSNNFKLQMVKLALQPGASVARIAREHDINDNLLLPGATPPPLPGYPAGGCVHRLRQVVQCRT
ncbi:transposase [Escherichia coli]|uniref:transposase n=1 Tax=Escherichia coli TaxID=562 RepID=UPI000C15ACC1|nr:hypothetical protein [Escherichia coli]EEW4124840.1 hypothetical protein [Escherichia coli]EEW4134759.1 hypothetical protein [Escherichia coli]EEW4139637.1 hypothetical protein [Escherichia coli]EEW4144572.1 hypothetical protein [Escherichia coli]